MRSILKARKIVMLAVLAISAAYGASLGLAQDPPKNWDPDQLLFTQQDVLPSFGVTGVRLGTVTGIINGTITTNYTFTVPPPPTGGDFTADDIALIVDPEGDQILFSVHSEGKATFDTLSGFINPFRAPFTATYTVMGATGRLSKYQGQVFAGRGTGVISSLLFPSGPPPVGLVFAQVNKKPIKQH